MKTRFFIALICLLALHLPQVAVSTSPASMLPELSVTPNPFVFDDTFVGHTTTGFLTFSNVGDQPLTVTDITFTNPIFSIDYTAFVIDPGESGELPVYFSPLAEGYFVGLMQIYSDDPVNNPYEVQLSGNGTIELNNGWQWIETGFDFILMDMVFPEDQKLIGYCAGQSLTYNGDGIVIKTTDGGDSWDQLTPDGIPGLMTCSFTDINTGYAAGWDGYIIKTTDGGLTWDTLFIDPTPWMIESMEFRDENNGVVSAYDNIYVTDDGGQSWTAATGFTLIAHDLTYASDEKVFAVGGDNIINRSLDGGYTWEQVYSGVIQELLLGVDFYDENFGMAVGDYSFVLITQDGGNSWSSVQPTGDLLISGVAIWDPDSAYFAGTPELIYKTTNGGIDWISDFNGNFDEAFYKVLLTPDYTIYVCGSGGVVLRKEFNQSGPEISAYPNPLEFDDTYVASSSQKTLTVFNYGTETLDVTDLQFSEPQFASFGQPFTVEPGGSHDLVIHFYPDEEGVIEGTLTLINNDPQNPNYVVYLSGTGITDLNMGWEWIVTGHDYILMDIEFPEGQNQVGYCVGQSLTYNGVGIVIKTEDSGYTWEQMTPEGIPGLEAMSFVDMNTGFAAGWDGYIIKTTDGGATWDTLDLSSIQYWEIYDMEFWDENNGVVTEFYGTYVTADGGQTWTTASGMTIMPYKIEYASEYVMFAAGGNGVCKSTDGGYTWTEVYSGSLMLGLDFLDEQNGLVVGDYGVILQTFDGGNNWVSSTPFNDQLLHGAFMWDEDTLHVCGTPELLFKSTNGGNNWYWNFNSNWMKAFYAVTFTDNYTGFVCGGSGGVVLRKEGFAETAEIAVSPENVLCDSTIVGETSTTVLTVTNTGLAQLTISDIIVTTGVFNPNMTSFTVEPGASQEIEITFLPDVPGLHEGLLIIDNNDPQNSLLEVPISGYGYELLPVITVDPSELAFDTTLVNGSSQGIITVYNTGLAELVISEITSSEPVFSVGISSMSIEPGTSASLEVTFSPLQPIDYSGYLVLVNNDPDNPQLEIPLTGVGDLETSIPSVERDNLRLYPNPVRDNLFVENAAGTFLTVFNLFGQELLRMKCTEEREEISFLSFQKGIYLLRFSGPDDIRVERIEKY